MLANDWSVPREFLCALLSFLFLSLFPTRTSYVEARRDSSSNTLCAQLVYTVPFEMRWAGDRMLRARSPLDANTRASVFFTRQSQHAPRWKCCLFSERSSVSGNRGGSASPRASGFCSSQIRRGPKSPAL